MANNDISVRRLLMGNTFHEWFNEFGNDGFVSMGEYFEGEPNSLSDRGITVAK